MNSITSSNQELLQVHNFHIGLIKTYTFILNNRIADLPSNFSEVFVSKVKEIQDLIRDPIVRKHLFNPKLIKPFNATYSEDIIFETNNGFLYENYLYELNNFATGIKPLSDFTRSMHLSFTKRFKIHLFEYTDSVLSNLEDELEEAGNEYSMLFTQVLVTMISIASVAITGIVIYQIIVSTSFNGFYDIFLCVESDVICKITHYIQTITKIVQYKFSDKELEDAPGPKDLKLISPEIIKRNSRQWLTKKRISNLKKFTIGLAIICLFGVFTLGYFYINEWQSQLIEKLVDLREDSVKILDSQILLINLLLNAKDFYINPITVFLMNPEYVDFLNAKYSTNKTENEAFVFSDSRISDLYKKSICGLVNTTSPFFNDSCSEVYSGLLDNNMEVIAGILYSKLKFVFTNESLVHYNYTSWHINELDKVNLYLEMCVGEIYSNWSAIYDQEFQVATILQIGIIAAKGLILLALTAIYLRLSLGSLKFTYSQAREIFLHLLPAGTLSRNKLAQSRLRKIGFLRNQN